MKRKYFLIKVLGILAFILVAGLYYLFYFVPSIKDISAYKRQLKDMNLKITDFVKMENSFSFSNEEERGYFRQSEEELKEKIPQIRSREDFLSLVTRVSNQVRNLAKGDGIFNLVLTSRSQDLNINAGSMSTDKKSLEKLLEFSSQQLSILRRKQETETRTLGPNESQGSKSLDKGLSRLLQGIKTHTLWLSFTGELPNAMNFVNHIPWSNYYLSEDKIIISTGDVLPYYILSLKVWYIDSKDVKGGPGTVGETAR
ncbi:MAG: hypothetical protein GY940_20125 [bacterium]|nr:hypothetical protein [bacterium]